MLALRACAALALAVGVLLPVSAALAAPGGAPHLIGAASRKTHVDAGTFDIPLSLVASDPTTEPRSDAAPPTIVFYFDKPVTSGRAEVTEGVATPGAVTFSGNQMIVPLLAVADEQYITVVATGVVAADGGTGGTGSVRVGLLAGDVNQNRAVTLADMLQVNSWLTQAVTTASFRNDIDATGAITLADKLIVNSRLTRNLPAPPSSPANQPPRVNAGASQRVIFPRGASLSGRVTDDGQPSPPGDVSIQWGMRSGPGTVEFSNANQRDTFAIFDSLGYYVLRLVADDGWLGNFADVMIAVASPNSNRMLLTMTGLADPIEVQYFGEGAAQQARFCTGTSCPSPKVAYQDAYFVAAESAATPLQLLWLGTGNHVNTARLQVLSPITEALVSDWTLSDVVVSSARVRASNVDDAPPTAEISLFYSKVQYRVYDANGSIAASSCWDIKSARKC